MGTIRALLWTVSFSALAVCTVNASESQNPQIAPAQAQSPTQDKEKFLETFKKMWSQLDKTLPYDQEIAEHIVNIAHEAGGEKRAIWDRASKLRKVYQIFLQEAITPSNVHVFTVSAHVTSQEAERILLGKTKDFFRNFKAADLLNMKLPEEAANKARQEFQSQTRLQLLKEEIQREWKSDYGQFDEDLAQKIATLAMSAKFEEISLLELGKPVTYLKIWKKLRQAVANPQYQKIHRDMLADVSRKMKKRVTSELTEQDIHLMLKRLFMSLTLEQVKDFIEHDDAVFKRKFDELFIPALKDHAHSSLQ